MTAQARKDKFGRSHKSRERPDFLTELFKVDGKLIEGSRDIVHTNGDRLELRGHYKMAVIARDLSVAGAMYDVFSSGAFSPAAVKLYETDIVYYADTRAPLWLANMIQARGSRSPGMLIGFNIVSPMKLDELIRDNQFYDKWRKPCRSSL